METISPTQSQQTTDSVVTDIRDPLDIEAEAIPDKIRAYYSLAFPNFTYYLQTLSVTIGRRSAHTGAASSSSDASQIDIDLGPLKNVSRLHARIEYEEDNERFVLAVLGRNGAWVDGQWSGSGARVPLGARSQIQIATRLFDFVLPPPPAQEDSPAPSEPPLSPRQLSPSIDLIDVTSLSPDSSLPTPPPIMKELPPPKLPERRLSSKAISRINSRKRKKPDSDIPKPEVMPPRPPLTYAQLCYRGIKAIDGKATLQEICHWVSENFDWYRYNEGSGWENSIRHSLSSNRAFEKLERCAGERGKGFFWRVDSRFEHIFEEQERTAGSVGKGKGKVPLDPPLKRSVKGEMNAPLPPPLTTSRPRPPSSTSPAQSSSILVVKSPPITTDPTAAEAPPGEAASRASMQAFPSVVQTGGSSHNLTVQVLPSGNTALKVSPAVQRIGASPDVTRPALPPATLASPDIKGVPATEPSIETIQSVSPLVHNGSIQDVKIPIVFDSMPADLSSTDAWVNNITNTTDRPFVLRDYKQLVLNPIVFADITPERIKELEEVGAKRAVALLQPHLVRYLKGSRLKDKNKGKVKKTKKGREGSSNSATAAGNGEAKPKASAVNLFTTAPLQARPLSLASSPPPPQIVTDSMPATFPRTIHDALQLDPSPPVLAPNPAMAMLSPRAATSPPPMGALASPTPPIEVQMDIDGPAMKKRRITEVSG